MQFTAGCEHKRFACLWHRELHWGLDRPHLWPERLDRTPLTHHPEEVVRANAHVSCPIWGRPPHFTATRQQQLTTFRSAQRFMISPEWSFVKLLLISFKVTSNMSSYHPALLNLRLWAPTPRLLTRTWARHWTWWASCDVHGRSHPLVGECVHDNVFLLVIKKKYLSVWASEFIFSFFLFQNDLMPVFWCHFTSL